MNGISSPVAVISPHGEHEVLPPLDGPSREVLDLALLAIDGMQELPLADRAREEREVEALLGDLEADESRMRELKGWLQAAAGTGEMRYSILARLMGVQVTERTEGRVSADEIAQRIESQSYVKEAPRFRDQLEDESRAEVEFEYDGQTFSDPIERRGRELYRTNELGGIRELSGFVEGFIGKAARHLRETGFRVLQNSAKSMRDNLTYIGGKELDEGSFGFAHYWSNYLAQDETNQLCIITTSSLISEQGRKRGAGQSDDFIKAEVLEKMAKIGVSEDSMSRVITDPTKLNGDPAKVKIVFIDDWVVSGEQMSKKIRRVLPLIKREYRGAIEVDVLTAPPHFVNNGLDVDGASIPVRAYYRAHPAAAEASEGVRCHITGTHATVNWGVSVQIERMQGLMNAIRGPGQREVRMPAVASVYRQYWNSNPGRS